MLQYQDVLELSSLDGNNGVRAVGGDEGGLFGYSVAAAGDINGDGFDDFMIGAPFAYDGPVLFDHNYGITYVVLSGVGVFAMIGEERYNFAGFSVSSAGDINGDGFDDMIVGAWGNGENGEGAAYVVFGKASGLADMLLGSLDGNDGFKIVGENTSDGAGKAVGSAGDFNGDGFGDVIVGAPAHSVVDSGGAYVVFGKASGWGATFSLGVLDGSNGFQIDGELGDLSGRSVSTAGDLNGDGFDDLIVGASNDGGGGAHAGAAYVVFGTGAAMGANLDLSALDGDNGFKLLGEDTYDYCGVSVASAGDVNGDGIADLIVGAALAEVTAAYSGAAYVVFGSTSGFAAVIDLGALDGDDGFRINGEAADNGLGYSVNSAGDFNGDGFDDLIVGAYIASPNGTYSGASYVVFGKASGWGAAFDPSTLDGNNGFQINGEAEGDRAGCSVAGAGDVNADGFDDLLIGAKFSNAGGYANGAAYIIYGHMPDEAVTRQGTAIANTIHGSDFADALSGLGGSDTLIGHNGNDTLSGDNGNDTINGGVGGDTIYGGSANDTLNGDNGNDKINGDAGGDTINGGVGTDTIGGGSGDDTLNGDNGNDNILGGTGKDVLDGGQGADRFIYGAAADSTGVGYDFVKGADFAADRFDLTSAVTGIDATIATGQLRGGHFNTDLAAAANKAHLGAHHAVLFTPDTGGAAGKIFLIVDLNGVVGYQAGQDLVVNLSTPLHIASIDTGDFI